MKNEASSNNAHSLSVGTVTFLIAIQNALNNDPCVLEVERKILHTDRNLLFGLLVIGKAFEQHLVLINIESLAPDALHLSVRKYITL